MYKPPTVNRCFLLLLCAADHPPQPQEIFSKSLTGKVVAVADGDTLTVLDPDHQQHKIRLEGIDSPEKKQAFGRKAGENLSAKVFGKTVKVLWNDTDRYDRKLGHVFLGEWWINYELVREGWAGTSKNIQTIRTSHGRRLKHGRIGGDCGPIRIRLLRGTFDIRLRSQLALVVIG